MKVLWRRSDIVVGWNLYQQSEWSLWIKRVRVVVVGGSMVTSGGWEVRWVVLWCSWMRVAVLCWSVLVEGVSRV